MGTWQEQRKNTQKSGKAWQEQTKSILEDAHETGGFIVNTEENHEL
jgi:hypothetical protein